MKKTSIPSLLFILFTLFSTTLFASPGFGETFSNSEDLIFGHESEIYAAFASVDELVERLDSNESDSFESLSKENSPLLENVEPDPAILMNAQETLTPPLFGAYVWGCCYGPLGLVLVAVTTNNDRHQVREAAKGCVAFHIAAAVLYGVTFLLTFSAYY